MSYWVVDVRIGTQWYYWGTWYVTPLLGSFASLDWRSTPVK